MTAVASKLPAHDRPLISDPDLAAALERVLEPLNGKALERAHLAIRRVRASGVVGSFGDLLKSYTDAIVAAAEK